MLRRTLLQGALLLSALSLAGASHAAPQATTTRDCVSGRTAGAWDLPGAGEAGAMSGILAVEGRPGFRVRAQVLRGRSRGELRTGTIAGVLEALTPSGPLPVARVRGSWVADGEGNGRFRASFVRPGPRPNSPAVLLGGMRGGFQDPSARVTGRFQGAWKICRP